MKNYLRMTVPLLLFLLIVLQYIWPAYGFGASYRTLNSGDKICLRGFYSDRLSFCYSSNPDVISVGNSGLLTAGEPGRARILFNNLGKSESLSVLVRNPSDQNISYSKAGAPDPDFNIEPSLLFMEKGDTYKCNVTFSSGSPLSSGLSWRSDNPEVAKVSPSGKITARKKGTAVLHCSNNRTAKNIYVTVVTPDYDGKSCDFTMLDANGKERTYRLFKQNAHNYPKYNRYIAWHGCATCSLATVLGAFNDHYKGILPSTVIDGPEKAAAKASSWEKEHVTHPLKRQMPISLFGISSILRHYDVENEYVRTYQHQEGKEDILSHLQTGGPVIIEVRQKSNRTGKKTQRWTNSYHTMVLLGVLTNGKVLLCDSVDRSWYKDGERLKLIELDDVMEFMYSCTSFSESMYFDGAASDGGYIKIYENNDIRK